MSTKISTALVDNKEVEKRMGRKKNIMLDHKIKLFCRRYIENGFNGSKTYKEIYKVKNDNLAKVNASNLLTNANIREYILSLIPNDDLKEKEIIIEAFNKERPNNISWRDLARIMNLSLTMKGKLNKDTKADIKIGLVINN